MFLTEGSLRPTWEGLEGVTCMLDFWYPWELRWPLPLLLPKSLLLEVCYVVAMTETRAKLCHFWSPVSYHVIRASVCSRWSRLRVTVREGRWQNQVEAFGGHWMGGETAGFKFIHYLFFLTELVQWMKRVFSLARFWTLAHSLKFFLFVFLSLTENIF